MIISKKRITIIGTNGIPSNYGGFETLVENLVEKLSDEFDLTVYCSSTQKYRLKNYKGASLKYLPFKANGIQSFIYDSLSIVQSIFSSDLLIILGFNGGFTIPILTFFKVKFLYNPGGIEEKKTRGYKLFSKIEEFLKIGFNRGFYRFSKFIILDNESFLNSIKNYYSKCKIIEYGGVSDYKFKYNSLSFEFENYDITVSRAQEDMNIEMVIKSYIKLERNLVVISNWSSSKYGQNLFKLYSNKYKNIKLMGPVYDRNKLNDYRYKAEIYIHSHKYCGTAPSLVEAMSLGLCVFSYNTQANKFTTENKAYYFNSEKDLRFKLKEITKQKIKDCANKMKFISLKKYDWKIIAKKYKTLIYESFKQN